MRAIEIEGEGRDARLVPGEAPDPRPGPDEICIDISATAVNRADLMQARGLYAPPPGASPILGLECAGRIASLGSRVTGWKTGERVMALLPGGGYAERVAVHAGSVMRVPDGMPLGVAAALPEVFLTCHLTLLDLGRVRSGETVLLHGGGSGIGTAGIQLLRRVGARVIVTAGSEEKCERCRQLGAGVAICYRDADFVEAARKATDGRGVDVILDHIGASYLSRNVETLARGGRLVLIGLMGGASAELNLGAILARNLSVLGSTLRGRSVEEKAALVDRFVSRFGDDVASGAIAPVIDGELPLEQAQAAHERLEASEHFGKVVLRVRPD